MGALREAESVQKTFASLTIKTVDEAQRIVEGIATVPALDLAGDSVLPEGAEFDLPIPFMLDHNHSKNVGTVELAEVTSAGIRFRARVAKIATPGAAKDLVDEAWSLLTAGLRPAVSIGFLPLSAEPLPGGGWLYRAWRWLELSAVSVACQPEARVTGLKRAPGRRDGPRVVKLPKVGAGASAKGQSARSRSGALIIDEKQHLRRARAALAHVLGEKNVPRFPTLEALRRWEDLRQISAKSRGTTFIGYEALMRTAPRSKPTRVVRID